MADLNLKAGTNMSIRQEDTDLYLDNTYEYDDTQIQQDLLTRSLITETGKTIELTLNNTNYKMTAILKNKYGTVISTSNEIDLPIESLVVSIYYDSTTKELVFVLKDGTTTRVPLLDLIDGLATEEDLQTLEDDINEDMETFKGDVEQELEKAQQDLSMYKMLENALPKVEGEGENITLEDTAKCPMKVGFKGQIQQDSTTGKNLFDKATITTGKLINKNTGAEDNDVSTDCSDYIDVSQFEKVILSGATVSYSNGGAFYDNSKTYISGFSSSALKNELTIVNGAKYLRFNLLPVDLDTAQLESGSIATDYEPYTGGSPSPSPSYPQDMHIVSGDNEIKVCNKNLLNITTTLITDRTNNGITTKVNDNQTITISGTASSTARYFTSDDNNKIFLKAGTYTISTNSTMPIRLGTKKISGPTHLVADTFTIDEDFYIYNGRFNLTNETTYNETIWIQLEKGSTATSYVPHQGYTKEINLSVENLFDKTDIETGKYYKTSAVDTSSNWAISQVKVQPNTNYYLSGNNYNNNTAKIVLLDSSKNILSSVGGYYDTHLITTSSTTAYIGLSIAIHEGVDDLNTIQLELGSKANSYSPFGTTPIEVGGIGEYEDEFFKNTIDSEYYDSTLEQDKWYLKKRIGKVVLDGSENWTYNSAGVNYSSFNLHRKELGVITSISNYFAGGENGSSLSNFASRNNDNTIGFSSTGNFMYIKATKFTSSIDFKTWLSTHNTTVYYVLATPTNTLLNDTLQETLDSFYSWQEQTNISQENNDLPFVIKASAIYDLTDLVNRVATLETE